MLARAVLEFAGAAAGLALSQGEHLAELSHYCGSLSVYLSLSALTAAQAQAITAAFDSHIALRAYFQSAEPNAWTSAYGRYYQAAASVGAPPTPPTPPPPHAPAEPLPQAGPACWSGLECSQGYFCNRLLTRCMLKRPGGLACTDAAQCASDACVKECEPAYPYACQQVCADTPRPPPWRLVVPSWAATKPGAAAAAGAAAAGGCRATAADGRGGCPVGYRCQEQGGQGACLPQDGAQVDCGSQLLGTPCASGRCKWRCAGDNPFSCLKVGRGCGARGGATPRLLHVGNVGSSSRRGRSLLCPAGSLAGRAHTGYLPLPRALLEQQPPCAPPTPQVCLPLVVKAPPSNR